MEAAWLCLVKRAVPGVHTEPNSIHSFLRSFSFGLHPLGWLSQMVSALVGNRELN